MRYLVYFPILFLFSCSSVIDDAEESTINLFNSHTIKFIGETSIENADLFEEALSKDSKTLNRLGLNITFKGGEQTLFSREGIKSVQIFTLSSDKLDSLLILHKKRMNNNKEKLATLFTNKVNQTS